MCYIYPGTLHDRPKIGWPLPVGAGTPLAPGVGEFKPYPPDDTDKRIAALERKVAELERRAKEEWPPGHLLSDEMPLDYSGRQRCLPTCPRCKLDGTKPEEWKVMG